MSTLGIFLLIVAVIAGVALMVLAPRSITRTRWLWFVLGSLLVACIFIVYDDVSTSGRFFLAAWMLGGLGSFSCALWPDWPDQVVKWFRNNWPIRPEVG